MNDLVHGRYSSYTSGGCRCDLCRKANSTYKSIKAKSERRELKRLRARALKRQEKN